VPVIQSPLAGRQVACHLYPEHTSLPPIHETDGLSAAVPAMPDYNGVALGSPAPKEQAL
jgi:hypothetical protein